MEDVLVADRYLLLALLGGGAQGEVFRARDLLAGSNVALKRSHRSTPPREAGRALREGSVLRMLRVPGVVPVLDEGEHEGRAFVVTALVVGSAFPGRPGPTRWAELEPVTARLLERLDAVHGAGVVHGDLKPANVLVDPEGAPWILDFGSARAITARAAREGRAPDAGATPAYVAPERVRGRAFDVRADVYAVGVMLHEALTGSLPHVAATPSELLRAKLSRAATPIRALAGDLPAPVAEVIDAMLALDPDARPRSLGEVRAELARAALPSPLAGAPREREDGGEALTEAELEALFVGEERLHHARSDAAAALHRATRGDRARVRDELARWCRLGVARESAGSFHVDRDSLDLLDVLGDGGGALEPDALFGAARRAWSQGRVSRAAALLEESARCLRRSATEEARGLAIEVFTAWIEAIVAEQAARGADVLQYELARRARPLPCAGELAELARAVVEMTADHGRAFRRLEGLGALASPRLERCRIALRMVTSRAGALEDEERVLADATAHAERAGDRELLARLVGWRGRVAYRAGRYAAAAGLHLRSAEALATPIDAVAARLNAAASLLFVPDIDAALATVAAARRALAELRAPLHEARAAWLERQARYQRGDELTPDVELAEAAASLGVRHVEAQIALTEAAVAWRAGARELAQALAVRAEAAWRAIGTQVEFAWLARALRAAAGETLSGAEIAGTLTAACASAVPGVGVQTLGLLALAGVPLPAVARESVVALSHTVTATQWAARLDVLSVHEALAALGAAPAHPHGP